VQKNFANSNASVLSRGWIDAAHSASAAKPTPLQPGVWRTVRIALRAQDVLIARGHTLALAITLSDTEWTTPNSTSATLDIDLARSELQLPAVGGLRLDPTGGSLDRQTVHARPVSRAIADTSRVPS
jgi:X-Pro dipeptidyl-peptidase